MKELIEKIEYQDGEMCIRLKTRMAARRLVFTTKREIEEGKRFDIEISRHREKRSLDANAYCWVLLGKLAAVLGIPKTEIYRELIKDIGDNFEILPIRKKAVETFCSNWENRGLGWIAERQGYSKIKGYENVVVYYGSSVYDTKQMSTLINLLVEECKEQGIETLPPEKLAAMTERWNQ